MNDKPPSTAQCVFAILPMADGSPLLMIGIAEAAWEYIRDGKTNNFDLRKVGLPFAVAIFGCKDQAEGLKVLEAGAVAAGVEVSKDLHTDFGFDKPRKH